MQVKDNQYKEHYLNPPKNGDEYSCTTTESYEEQLPEAEIIPDTLIEAQGNICRVTSNVAKTKSCLVCQGTKVIPKNEKIANCPKCRITVKLQSCINDWQLKIIFVTSQKTTLRLSVFNSEISLLLSLCHLDTTCTEDDISCRGSFDPR